MTVSRLLHQAVVALASPRRRDGPAWGRRVAAALRGAGLRALLAGLVSRRHLGELLASFDRAGAAAAAEDGATRAVLDTLRRWPTTCLYRALAGYAVLRSEGQEVLFVIGVRPERGELQAHAWLEQRGRAIGEPVDPRERYAVAFVHPRTPATADMEREMPNTAFRPSPDVLLTELKDGSGVLLHLRTKFYYTLNRTGVAAWKLLAAGGTGTVEALAAAIVAGFRDAPPEAVRQDVTALVRELTDEGLLLPPLGGPPAGG